MVERTTAETWTFEAPTATTRDVMPLHCQLRATLRLKSLPRESLACKSSGLRELNLQE